jgi:hypothetical protein
MVNKYLKAMALILSISTYTLTVEITAMDLAPYAEFISGGTVTEKTEKRVRELLKDLGANQIIHIRKVSPKFLETYQGVKHLPMILHEYNCCYLNEEFFQNLTELEQRAALAYAVHGPEALLAYQKRRELPYLLGAMVTSEGIGIGTTFYLYKKKYGLAAISIGAYLTTTVSFNGLLILRNLLFPLLFPLSRAYFMDSYIAEKFDCTVGLINILKKAIATDPEYYTQSKTIATDLEYYTQSIDTFNKRIANLEAILEKKNK